MLYFLAYRTNYIWSSVILRYVTEVHLRVLKATDKQQNMGQVHNAPQIGYTSIPSVQALLHPCKTWRGKAFTAEQVDPHSPHETPTACLLTGTVGPRVRKILLFHEQSSNTVLWVIKNQQCPLHLHNPSIKECGE